MNKDHRYYVLDHHCYVMDVIHFSKYILLYCSCGR